VNRREFFFLLIEIRKNKFPLQRVATVIVRRLSITCFFAQNSHTHLMKRLPVRPRIDARSNRAEIISRMIGESKKERKKKGLRCAGIVRLLLAIKF